MSLKKTVIEINFTSNKVILGTDKTTHPFPTYLAYNVPVVISTDDEGILRTNLTEEYVIAARDYNLNYQTLKKISRNSLEYSFISGESLWIDNDKYTIIKPVCANSFIITNTSINDSCQQFLKTNKKAKLEWELENRFTDFEKTVVNKIK